MLCCLRTMLHTKEGAILFYMKKYAYFIPPIEKGGYRGIFSSPTNPPDPFC